jgi:hypothetical protein
LIDVMTNAGRKQESLMLTALLWMILAAAAIMLSTF